ncbi:MAG: glycosyltransferase family 9 protein [Chlamydiia bacterium]
MNILIVKLSSIGDVIQTYRAFSQIRFCYPQAKISWVVEEKFLDAVSHLKGVDEVIPIPFKEFKQGAYRRLIKKLAEMRKRQFDIVFDFQGNFKSAIVTFLVTAKVKIGFDREGVAEWPNLFVTNQKVRAPKSLPPPERNLLIVDTLTNGKRGAIPPIKLLLEREKRDAVEEFTAQFFSGFIMLCPFSVWDQKTLNTQQWIEWIQKIRFDWAFHVVIPYFSTKEEIIAREIEERFSHVHLWKISSLSAWQYLMSLSKLVIAIDSASLHLAGVADIPTFSIFGPTLDVVYRPMGEKHSSYQAGCPLGKKFTQKCTLLRTCSAPCLKKTPIDLIHRKFNQHMHLVLEKDLVHM